MIKPLSITGTPDKMVTYQKQNSSAAVLTITNVYNYDRRDRLIKQTQQIGTGSVETIVANTYNELGVLINKKVGGTTANLQNIQYRYNIRGWLTHVNNPDPLLYDPSDNSIFKYHINYTTVYQGDTSKPQFNGNISSVSWRTSTDNIIRGYGYNYDYLNRLTYASHLKATIYNDMWFSFTSYNRDGQYAEDLTYDKNGNITTLKRFGEEELGQPIQTDELTYTYTSNQLQNVTDATNSPAGFNDGNKVGNDYAYDTLGNITQDKNKGITAISYNHLNLPYQVTFGNGSNIKYTYDAAGTRLKKQVQPSGGALVTTDYVNGFQYENNVLQFFPHAEGYVKRNTNNTYLYVYQYKDHLGNIRLSYADVNGNGSINLPNEILEENNYYPFGLKHKGYNEVVNSNRSEAAEKYKFGGKELNDELGLDLYDFGARNYDAAIGRWLNVDPLAEETMEPYLYTGNNPIMFTDPTGMSKVGPPDPPLSAWNKLRADLTNAYSASGFRSGALWLAKNNPLTPAKPQVKIRSNQDIGSSVRSKSGGNENPTTTGKYKKGDHGGSFNVDYILGAASAFGGPYNGNKYKGTKDFLEAIKTAASGYGTGEATGESTVETGKNVYKETMEIISTYEIFAGDGKIDSVKTEYKIIELEAKTQEDLKMKIDSTDYDNNIEKQRRDAWLQ